MDYLVNNRRLFLLGALIGALGASPVWVLGLFVAVVVVPASRIQALSLVALAALVSLVCGFALVSLVCGFVKHMSDFREPDRIRRDSLRVDTGQELDGRAYKLAESSSLTDRETEILVLLSRGRNAERVAEILGISPHTSKTHIYSIYRKLGVHSLQDLLDKIYGPDIFLASNS